MDNVNKLVSIIMPCYNSASTIARSIDSILSQTYRNWELLITNDCSSDNSVEIIDSYMLEDHRIKLYTLSKNSGVAAARNNSLNNATGHYIAFLDSDDTWLPKKLELQLAFMVENNYNFSYTAYRKIDINDFSISRPINVSTEGVNYSKLLKHNEIACLTVMLNKELLNEKRMIKVGHEDFVFWLSILKEGVVAYGINEVLAGYRVGNESISSNKIKAAGFTWNIYRNVEKLNFFKSLYYFSNYAFFSMIKFLK